MATIRQSPRDPDTTQLRFGWKGKQYTYNCINETHAKAAKAAVELLTQELRAGRRQIPPNVENLGLWLFTDGKEGLAAPDTLNAPKKPARSITDLVADYLDKRARDVRSGSLDPTSYDSDDRRCNKFLRYCIAQKQDTITALFSMMDEYREVRQDALAEGKCSPVTLKHELRTVRDMVKYGWKKEWFDQLPRWFEEYASVRLPDPTPQHFEVDEVKRMFAAASKRTKLYILLGLNCGYTQIDISTLTHDMMVWETGYIDRTRHKTNYKVSRPQVNKLWPITLKLLTQEATNPRASEFVLLGTDGNPLVNQKLVKEAPLDNPNGKPKHKYKRTDAVRLAFNRVLNKLKVSAKRRGFMNLRKTGANEIKQHYGHDGDAMADLYLAHASAAMRKHYVNENYDLLAEATDWLATVYEFKLEEE